jgi:hypothetical protein
LPKAYYFLYDVDMFFPTAQEVILLKLIKKKQGVTKQILLSSHKNQQMTKALEGCLIKGFIDIDAAGVLNLTEKGGDYI